VCTLPIRHVSRVAAQTWQCKQVSHQWELSSDLELRAAIPGFVPAFEKCSPNYITPTANKSAHTTPVHAAGKTEANVLVNVFFSFSSAAFLAGPRFVGAVFRLGIESVIEFERKIRYLLIADRKFLAPVIASRQKFRPHLATVPANRVIEVWESGKQETNKLVACRRFRKQKMRRLTT